MATRKVYIKNTTVRIPSNIIGHIGKFDATKLKVHQLPIDVILVDPETQAEYPSKLVAFVPLTNVIPEVFIRHSELELTEDSHVKIMERCNVSSIHQLAYYQYEPVRQ